MNLYIYILYLYSSGKAPIKCKSTARGNKVVAAALASREPPHAFAIPATRRRLTGKRPPCAAATTSAKNRKVSDVSDHPQIDMSDIFSTIEADGLSATRGSVTSRAYDAAKRRCRDNGVVGDVATHFARVQYQRAGMMWDALR